MKHILKPDYVTGYRDALDSLLAELRQGYASFWTEEQYEANRWILDKLKEKADAVGQMLEDAERTQAKLERRR
jgi:hypothetical protein